MTNVIWSEAAADRLADYYVTAPADQKPVIANAADVAQKRLRRDPWDGESRAEGRRVLYVGRFGVVFRIVNDGAEVRIIDVIWSQPRKR